MGLEANELQTDFEKLDSLYPLPSDELFKQWVVGRDASQLPAEWVHHHLQDLVLAVHPNARVLPLESADERQVGWVFEPMLYIDSKGPRIAKGSIRLSRDLSALTSASIEQDLYGYDSAGDHLGTGLEGMWIAVVATPQCKRVYPGPIHSVVYDRTKCRVATSHNLLGPQQRDRELSAAFDPLATNRFFSFGLTGFSNVQRLLPNHFLDLDTFDTARHWPTSPIRKFQPNEAAAAIVSHSRRIIGALANHSNEIHLPMSAGNDSRAVMSLLRPMIEAGDTTVTLHTTKGKGFEDRIDLQGARRLASIAELPLEERPRVQLESASDHVVMRNFARIGEAKAGRSLFRPPMPYKPREHSELAQRLVLAGMAGETARAFYWNQDLPDALTVDELLRRVGAPAIPKAKEAASRWLEGLPDFVRASSGDTLDLAYVEQRLGCWEANSRYLNPRPSMVVSPMASGFCIATMLGLPQACRASGTFQREMVALAWPELLDVPINQATGLLSLEHRVRRVLGPIKRFAARNIRGFANLTH